MLLSIQKIRFFLVKTTFFFRHNSLKTGLKQNKKSIITSVYDFFLSASWPFLFASPPVRHLQRILRIQRLSWILLTNRLARKKHASTFVKQKNYKTADLVLESKWYNNYCFYFLLEGDDLRMANNIKKRKKFMDLQVYVYLIEKEIANRSEN